MTHLLIPSAPSSAPHEPLEAGLSALLGGANPLDVALEALREKAGARRAVWVGESIWVAEEGRTSRALELPPDLPTRWINDSRAGAPAEILKLNSSDLARDPRARAAGLAEALVRRGKRGLLWLETSGRLQVELPRDARQLCALDWLAELQHREHEQAATEPLAHRGELAAGVAHDLRNQLSLAILESERVRLSTELDVSCIGHALQRARALCEEFLITSAPPAESGLATWLGEEVHAAGKLAGRRDEVRILTRDTAPLEARAPEQPFRRIVMNLALNAISASPTGSCVRIELRSSHDRTRLELEVSDEGRGMSEVERQQLFRAGQSRGGTGFGTSSVQACVTRIGGELSIDSSPGYGTRVTVSWPLGQGAEAATKNSAPPRD